MVNMAKAKLTSSNLRGRDTAESSVISGRYFEIKKISNENIMGIYSKRKA
jgi:hypothetical protein